MGGGRINLKIIFFGTPDFVIPVINKLNKEFRLKNNVSPISAVVTQPPRIVGRNRILTYSPVDKWAYSKKIKIIHNPMDLINNNINADIGILAAYGAIIPQQVIDNFPYGIINIHPSLLPEFRGASPVQATILTGKKETGVTFIKLDKLLDHGPIISSFKEEVRPDDTTISLTKRLFERASDVLIELIPAYTRGKINLKNQDHEKSTYTKLIQRNDGYIDFGIIKKIIEGKKINKKIEIGFIKDFNIIPNSHFINDLSKALSPWPGIWTIIKFKLDNSTSEKRLKIISLHLDNGNNLIIDNVQLEGKNITIWEEFNKHYSLI